MVNEKVKQFDIDVAIHNHGPGDKVYPTPESIYQKVEKLDKRIGLCIDIGHTVRIGADPIADAERFADRLLDLHIKDVSAAQPEGKTVECGRGVIDIPAFLRTLVKINYSRVASFEHEKDENDPLGRSGGVGRLHPRRAGRRSVEAPKMGQAPIVLIGASPIFGVVAGERRSPAFPKSRASGAVIGCLPQEAHVHVVERNSFRFENGMNSVLLCRPH